MKWSSLSAFQGKVVKLSEAEIKVCNFGILIRVIWVSDASDCSTDGLMEIPCCLCWIRPRVQEPQNNYDY